MINMFNREWEEVDHEDTLAGAITNVGSASNDAAGDPLGLGAMIE